MAVSLRYSIFLLLSFAVFCNAGLLKGRRHKEDDAVETLLAVGLIAKALADAESPPKVHCPAPIQVTKIVPVPIYRDRVIFVKDKSCEAKYHGNKEMWATGDSSEMHNWKGIQDVKRSQ